MKSFAKTLARKTGALKRFKTTQDDAQPVANTNPATTHENATSAVLEGNPDALHYRLGDYVVAPESLARVQDLADQVCDLMRCSKIEVQVEDVFPDRHQPRMVEDWAKYNLWGFRIQPDHQRMLNQDLIDFLETV